MRINDLKEIGVNARNWIHSAQERKFLEGICECCIRPPGSHSLLVYSTIYIYIYIYILISSEQRKHRKKCGGLRIKGTNKLEEHMKI